MASGRWVGQAQFAGRVGVCSTVNTAPRFLPGAVALRPGLSTRHARQALTAARCSPMGQTARPRLPIARPGRLPFITQSVVPLGAPLSAPRSPEPELPELPPAGGGGGGAGAAGGPGRVHGGAGAAGGGGGAAGAAGGGGLGPKRRPCPGYASAAALTWRALPLSERAKSLFAMADTLRGHAARQQGAACPAYHPGDGQTPGIAGRSR